MPTAATVQAMETTSHTTPAITRSNTTSSTTSTLHPHHSISRIFLEGSPIPPSPPPAVPAKSPARTSQSALIPARAGPAAYSALSLAIPPGPSRPPRPTRSPASRSGKSSVRSDLHLNLGNVHESDDCAPGPSPPWSAASSPTRRAHWFDDSPPLPPLPSQCELNAPCDREHALPPSPLTPSRAPSKAARLLGATVGSSPMFTPPRHGKKKDHFRPLPNQTLVEIERFFGSVPPKPPKKPNKSLKQDASDSKLSKAPHISGPLHLGGDCLGDRNVGHGGTVRHQGEDGSMWLDVEEEQEFAWLMSETYTQPAGLLPAARIDHKADGRAGSHAVLHVGTTAQAAWGMEAFTSVLSLPKGKRVKSTSTKAKHCFGESFFDFGDDDADNDTSIREKTLPVPRSARWKGQKEPMRLGVGAEAIPFSSSTESLQVVTPTKAGASSAHIRTAVTEDVYDSLPPRAESPPRLKNRPPPLRLAPALVDPRLPIVITTPGTSNATQSQTHAQSHSRSETRPAQSKIRANAPVTPFIRPRKAPVPGPLCSADSSSPRSKSAQRGYVLVPDVPPGATTAFPALYPPPTIAIPQLPPISACGLQGSLPSLGPGGRYDEEPIEISYFELDSPTDQKPAHWRHGRAATITHASTHGKGGRGGWLKKVVKPLAGAGGG